MNSEDIKILANATYKAFEPRRLFTKALQECTLPLDELFDKAIEEAESRYKGFKSNLDGQLKLYPLNKIEILREAASKLRKEDINRTWLGDGRTNREDLIKFLSRYYGKTDDGYTLYKEIIDTFRSKWSYEYLTLLTNNELNSEAVVSYKIDDRYKKVGTQEQQSGDYLLESDLLVKIHTTFNGILWESINAGSFLIVFTEGSSATLKTKKGKRELLCALLDRMYEYRNNALNKKDWVNPLLDKLQLNKGTFDAIYSKIFNKMYQEQSKAQREFMKALNNTLPLKEKSTY